MKKKVSPSKNKNIKAKYSAPKLIAYGSVEKLTAAKASGSHVDSSRKKS